MPTNKEIFDEKMNDLADSINTKAGTTGAKTIDQMTDTVRGIASVPEYPAEDGTYKLIATVDEGEGSMSWEEETPPSPSQYYAVTFMNGDTVFEIQVVPSGGDATTPSGTPYKEGDASHTYVFIGWSGSLTNITAPTTIQAVFMDLGAYSSIATPVGYSARGESVDPSETTGNITTSLYQMVYRNVGDGPPVAPNKSWIYSMIEIPDTAQNLVGVALKLELSFRVDNGRNDVYFSADVVSKLNEYNGAVWYKQTEPTIPHYLTLASPYISSITQDPTDSQTFHMTAEFIFLFGETVASDNLVAGIYTGWLRPMANSDDPYGREGGLTPTIISADYIPITQIQ